LLAGLEDAFGILIKDLVYFPTVKPAPERNSNVKLSHLNRTE